MNYSNRTIKIFRFIYSSFYFGLLSYLVFFARRRRGRHFNYEINFIPIKNTVNTFLSIRATDKIEVFNFYLNLFGNIFLFVPFSVILFRVFKVTKLKFVVLWAALLSIFIEANQYIFQVGYADIDDVILNVLGAVLGFFLYKLVLQAGLFPPLIKQTNLS